MQHMLIRAKEKVDKYTKSHKRVDPEATRYALL